MQEKLWTPICREELTKDIDMNFLSKEKVEFTEYTNVSSEKKVGQFIEFCTSSENGTYAIILKEDNTITIVPAYEIKFLGDFS